jgi:hypothetical protein
MCSPGKATLREVYPFAVSHLGSEALVWFCLVWSRYECHCVFDGQAEEIWAGIAEAEEKFAVLERRVKEGQRLVKERKVSSWPLVC